MLIREARAAATHWLASATAGRTGVPAAGAGIPLYRMRLDDARYRELAALLTRALASPFVLATPPRPLCGLFCLFATETLRRRESGQWSWEPVETALGRRTAFTNIKRVDLVEPGLAFWGLALRRDADGARRLLHSLVFQAGLPSSLLKRDESHRFLRAALGAIERFGADELAAAHRLVAEEARHLPPAWQQDITIELAVEFLLALLPVRRALRTGGPQAAPIGWQATLPIDLSDVAAAQLLQTLLDQPPARAAPRELVALCRRVLLRHADGYHQHLAPAMRGRVPPAFVAQPPFSNTDRPLRVRLSVAGSELALLESVTDGGAEWLYRSSAEPFAFAFDQPVLASLLVDGDEHGRASLPGGEAAGAGAWVFEQTSDSGWLERASEGSRATRAERLFVAVDPTTGRFEPRSGKVVEAGPVVGTARILYEITGDVLWCEPGAPFPIRLRTGIDQPNQAGMVIDTRRPHWPVLGAIACLGSPRVAAPGRGAQVLLRTRDGGEWRKLPPNLPHGVVELALVGDGMLIERRRLAILPEAAWITARQTRTGFEVEFAGFDPATVALRDFPGAARGLTPDGAPLLSMDTSRPPPELVVITRLAGADISHRVRPRLNQGLLLNSAGQTVAPNARLSFHDLRGMVAHARDASDPAEIAVSLTPDGDRAATLAGTRLARSLRFADEFPLARLLPELRRLYATAGGRDAQLRLAVRVDGVDGPPVLIGPYGATLQLERGHDQVRLAEGAPPSGSGLAAIAIARPGDAPVTLAPLDSGGWWLPQGDGPWLLAGTGTLAMQVRPTLFPGIPGDTKAGALTTAASCGNAAARGALFDTAFATLAAAPDAAGHAPEWMFLDATLRTGTSLAAPIFFDVLAHAARHPLVLAHWLIRAEDALLVRIAALEEGLPFAWVLLPMADWRTAARGFLARYADFPEIGRQALTARFDAIAECCPAAGAGLWEARDATGLPHARNEFAVTAIPLDLLRTQAKPDPGPGRWFEAIETCRDWENLPPLVHDGAPHMAARYALGQEVATPRAVAAIRFCRQRAADRFDADFRIAHLLHRADQEPDR
jgi:hypothetical protein